MGYGFMSISGLMRIHTISHRNTLGKNLNIIFKIMCPISMKFGINDLFVVPFYNTVYVNQEATKDPHCFTKKYYMEKIKHFLF